MQSRQSTTSSILKLCAKIDESNDHFRNFLLPLLGNKDQEIVLNAFSKVKQNVRGERRGIEGCQLLIQAFVAIIVVALAMSKTSVLDKRSMTICRS